MTKFNLVSDNITQLVVGTLSIIIGIGVAVGMAFCTGYAIPLAMTAHTGAYIGVVAGPPTMVAGLVFAYKIANMVEWHTDLLALRSLYLGR